MSQDIEKGYLTSRFIATKPSKIELNSKIRQQGIEVCSETYEIGISLAEKIFIAGPIAKICDHSDMD